MSLKKERYLSRLMRQRSIKWDSSGICCRLFFWSPAFTAWKKLLIVARFVGVVTPYYVIFYTPRRGGRTASFTPDDRPSENALMTLSSKFVSRRNKLIRPRIMAPKGFTPDIDFQTHSASEYSPEFIALLFLFYEIQIRYSLLHLNCVVDGISLYF